MTAPATYYFIITPSIIISSQPPGVPRPALRGDPSPLHPAPVSLDLRCEVTPAPFTLRPYAGLYNPFSHACSVLCNHPADTDAKEFVKKAKDTWGHDVKAHHFNEDLSKFHDLYGGDKDKIRTPHDLVTEDMFRRYAETDSRPLTPAPTLASGKSRGSRRCLTPDQTLQRTTIVVDLRRSHSQTLQRTTIGVDLRRSHSQETLYYHGYATSDLTAGHTSTTIERSTLPSLNLSEGGKDRLGKAQCEQLPPLASPLVLSKRNLPPKEAAALKAVRKNQLKALNLGKSIKGKSKGDGSGTHRSKGDKDLNDGAENDLTQMDDDEGGGGEMKRRGKRRRKGRQGGSDRLTSAGLTAQAQQDPETQVAGIGDDSHNPSSRGSLAPSSDASSVVLPVISRAPARQTDSFLDEELLKYLHREVDEDAIQTEFDAKRRYVLQEALRTRPDRPPGPELQSLVRELKVPARRYVLQEALRTRPDRPPGPELQTLVRELKVPAVSLGDWLHVPRVFSRKNAQFALPIDANTLETMSPMQYAAKYVTLKKSKQLLYLTVLRKFRPEGYLMPVENIEEGLILMMGGILSSEQARQFSATMEWQRYEEPEHFSDDIKLTILDHARRLNDAGDNAESEVKTLKYRTWCGLCAVCERVYGRFPPREKDPPEGMELSDFSMLETKMTLLKVHSGLAEVLNTIRTR
ncbi:hypothetical protein JYU34_005644 [Plutella xylostella]|uniref:Uncharacterized protein n=1 Tax=Plutella xylostella TaxID=51655 RepID=A0ABQ7QTR2_PLUXY|nr:hypothetical protein JYU34_005644 [Plutella xylostella]